MKGTQKTDEGLESEDLDRVDSGQSAADSASTVRWYTRILDGDVATLEDEELAEWAEWSEQPRLEKFRTLGRIWRRHVPVAANENPHPTAAELSADGYDGSVPYFEWIEKSTGKDRQRWRPGPLTIILALAACIAGLSADFLKYGHIQSLDNVPFIQRLLGREYVQSYTTRASERRDFRLPDGSQITLGAQTELTVHYTANRRFVFLDRGESSFSVARDLQRPFTVLAGGGAITAIGTQFYVRREVDATQGERVIVTVTGGTVEVGPPMAAFARQISKSIDSINVSGIDLRNQSEWAPARLGKGQELTFGTDGPKGKIEHVNLEEVAAWREGRLEYHHTPFKLVIPRVNRYSEKPIVLADGDVGELTYSGTVFEGQVTDWLHALQTLYPVDVTETADHFVLRYAREREQSVQ